jgi:hypothetical protein
MIHRPETANRTLAEIDQMYALQIPKKQWRKFKTTGTAIGDDEVATTGKL